MDIHQSRAIRQFIIVLLTAIIGAIGLAGYMLYYYNPTGHYIAGNTLISPETIKKLQNGKEPLLDFSRAEFTYWDDKAHKQRRIPVVIYDYEKFYHKIEQERSVEPSEEVIKSFDKPDISTLNIFVNDDMAHTPNKLFQVVEIVHPGDYYRIHLLGADSDWIYFKHPHIDQEAREYFHE